MSLDLSKLVNLRRNGSSWTAQCPVCAANGRDTKGRNHLGILSDGRFNCIVDNSQTHRSAIFNLVGVGQNGENPPIFVAAEPPVALDKTWPASVLERLVKDPSYWVKRGVKAEVLEPLKGGVAVDGQMKARYVFPIFDANGVIVGFTGRSLGNIQPRWKHIGRVSSWVWGGLDAIQETGQAILVEGAGCRLALDSYDIPQSLVLWGVNLSEALLAKLIELNPHDIVIATNNEVSGIGLAAAERIKKTLDKFFDDGVVRIGLPSKKDFLEMSENEINNWRETTLERKMPDNRTEFEIGLDSTDISEIIHS